MSALVMSVNVQMTGYCTTWNGEGDAAAGTRQIATEIEFHTDIDEDGVELVSAHAAHPSSTITCRTFSAQTDKACSCDGCSYSTSAKPV